MFPFFREKAIRIKNIFAIQRGVEESEFQKNMDNQKLFFHSSTPSNFVGILSRYDIGKCNIVHYTVQKLCILRDWCKQSVTALKCKLLLYCPVTQGNVMC